MALEFWENFEKLKRKVDKDLSTGKHGIGFKRKSAEIANLSSKDSQNFPSFESRKRYFPWKKSSSFRNMKQNRVRYEKYQFISDETFDASPLIPFDKNQ